MKDARIRIIKKGQMTYYQPELFLGWWIFKRWTAIQAFTLIGYVGTVIEHLYNNYDEAMKQFDEYHKLTNNEYRMTHSRLIN